jgi:CHAT domain-containing protein/tetratricopeptide (TPR) repeat protein
LLWPAALLLLALALPGARGQISKLAPAADAVPEPETARTVTYGRLTAQDPLDRRRPQSHCRVFQVKLEAGKAYAFDLKSMVFDAFLRLEDAQGREVAADDQSGGYTDAWLVFVPQKSGTYQLVVTTFAGKQTGDFVLTQQRFAHAIQARAYHTLELQTVLWSEQGRDLGGRGKYAAAQGYYFRALALQQKLYPARDYPRGHPYMAYTLNTLGSLSAHQEKHDQAVAYCRQALAMRRRLYPAAEYSDGHPHLAMILRALGWALEGRREFGEALAHYREALAMLEKLYPERDHPNGHPDIAGVLLKIASVSEALGAYTAAAEHYRRALALQQKLYPARDHPLGHADIARTWNNLGWVCFRQGDFTQAINCYQTALPMWQKLYPRADYPRGHIDIATTLNNLGLAYSRQGKYGDATKHYLVALRILRGLYPRAEFPRGHRYLAMALQNLGVAQGSQGELIEALGCQREAMAMCEALYPADEYPNGHPILAGTLQSLGDALAATHRPAEAVISYRRAVDMQQKLHPAKDFPRGHPDLAQALGALGRYLDESGDHEQAVDYLRKTIAMQRKLYPASEYPRGHPHLAQSLNNLGSALDRQGKSSQALGHYRESLAMRHKLYPIAEYPSGHPDLIESLLNIGFGASAQADEHQALDCARQALAMEDKLLGAFFDTASEMEALNFLARLPLSRDFFLSVTASDPKHEVPPAAETYRALWPGRSLVTRLSERRHLDLQAATDPETRALAEQLATVRAKLVGLLLNPPEGNNGALIERLSGLKERLERYIAQKLRLPQPAATSTTPEQLAAALPPKAVFIDILHYVRFQKDPSATDQAGWRRTPSYVAFVVAPGKIERVELGSGAPIDKAIRAWRAAIVREASGAADEEARQAASVRQLVWDKLAPHLPRGTATIYLAPDRSLTQLPWAALPGARPGTILLEDYSFAVVPHGPFLLRELTTRQTTAGPGSLLLVGGVSYDSVATSPLAALQGSQQTRSEAELKGQLTWPALAGTSREVKQIQKLAQGRWSIELLDGTQADADAVRQKLPQARFAHFATHGFFADRQFRSFFHLDEKLFEKVALPSGPGLRLMSGARNPLILSGLVFAGANRPETPGRGILVADTIVGLELHHLDLAVLSACETGLGDVAGGEGSYGLQRAFHVAGCKNVVASLWRINDESTAALMQLFYQGLWQDQLDPVEALRAAQLSIYHHPEKVKAWASGERAVDLAKKYKKTGTTPAVPPSTTNPRRAPARLWAAFVLSGTGQRLEARSPTATKPKASK